MPLGGNIPWWTIKQMTDSSIFHMKLLAVTARGCLILRISTFCSRPVPKVEDVRVIGLRRFVSLFSIPGFGGTSNNRAGNQLCRRLTSHLSLGPQLCKVQVDSLQRTVEGQQMPSPVLAMFHTNVSKSEILKQNQWIFTTARAILMTLQVHPLKVYSDGSGELFNPAAAAQTRLPANVQYHQK